MKVSRRKLAMAVVSQLRSSKDRAQVVRGLAAYLVEHKMTNQAELLMKDIARLLAETEGHLLAEVTSAFALTPDTRKSIEGYIRAKTGATTIELTESVNPDLVGGFTLRIPGRELDASIRHKLNQLVTE